MSKTTKKTKKMVAKTTEQNGNIFDKLGMFDVIAKEMDIMKDFYTSTLGCKIRTRFNEVISVHLRH